VSEPPITRGFLFADLRDYTAFVERHGNAAAAELLARYRGLVREQVGRHDGAEIRTEGDSFYVVFPSASGAVACGLAIVEAAEEAGVHPPGPIRVGIGIHAGETVETAEGYIGAAVNLAARVAGAARPGEVLVTDTVRNLVRGSASVHFAGRGRHRLKGIPEPVALFAVFPTGASATPARPHLSRAAGLAAAVGITVVGALAAFALLADRTAPSPSVPPSSPDGSPVVIPTADADLPFNPVQLEPGQRYVISFDPPVAFEVRGGGWAVTLQAPDVFEIAKSDETGLYGYIDGARVQVVFDAPCPDALTRTLNSTPQAFAEWLLSNQHLQATTPTPISVGGHVGLEMEFEYAQGPGTECAPYESPGEEHRLHLFPVGRTTFKLDPGERVHVFSVDVSGTALTFLVGTFDPDLYPGFLEEARTIIESITIDGD